MLKEANENKLEIFWKIRNVYINLIAWVIWWRNNCKSYIVLRIVQMWYYICRSLNLKSIRLLTFSSTFIYDHILIADLTSMHESTLNKYIKFLNKMFSKGVIWLFHLMFSNIFCFHAFWSLSIKIIEALKLCIFIGSTKCDVIIVSKKCAYNQMHWNETMWRILMPSEIIKKNVWYFISKFYNSRKMLKIKMTTRHVIVTMQ